MLDKSDAILVDLNDYEYAGEGANGASFNHKTNPDIMMKLYNATAPFGNVINELEKAHLVYDAGIPSPKPGDFITNGEGRYGIRFKRIKNKKSYSRATGDEPQRVEEFARDFARMCLELHSTHMDVSKFENIKDRDIRMIKESPFFKDDEREKVLRFVENAPEADTAIHGDLQFSNAIMSEEGKFFIDLGDFAYGHPYFDLGMVLLTCKYDSPEFLKEVFHLEPDTAAEFWVYFVKEYFGENEDPDKWEKIIRPYAGLKVLIIERDCNTYFPEFHALFDGLE